MGLFGQSQQQQHPLRTASTGAPMLQQQSGFVRTNSTPSNLSTTLLYTDSNANMAPNRQNAFPTGVPNVPQQQQQIPYSPQPVESFPRLRESEENDPFPALGGRQGAPLSGLFPTAQIVAGRMGGPRREQDFSMTSDDFPALPGGLGGSGGGSPRPVSRGLSFGTDDGSGGAPYDARLAIILISYMFLTMQMHMCNYA